MPALHSHANDNDIMIQLKTNGEILDLPSDFSISIEDSNPIFNDRGSQSIPATVPPTSANRRILGFPERADSNINPHYQSLPASVSDGIYIRHGITNIISASLKDGIELNIGFDNSIAYQKWMDKKLNKLSELPVFIPESTGGGYPIDWLFEFLERNYEGANPQKDDFAVFPLALSKEDVDGKTYWEILNLFGEHGLTQPSKVMRVMDGTVTEVTVPEGYCVSPFLRVWRVLELIFTDLGLTVDRNPFKEDQELARLVVLNNTADAICRAKIDYSDLLPDCTVEEFLNALRVRFGLIYNIDYNSRTAILRLIRDIVHKPYNKTFDDMLCDYPKISYETPKYIKLSAKTSIEGASPACERFEDFIRGLDLKKLHMGADVSEWINRAPGQDHNWDGDTGDGYWDQNDDDYDYPDDPFEDDREDDRDDDWDDFYARSVSPIRNNRPLAETVNYEGSDDKTFIAREYITGNWYSLDMFNSKVKKSSSGFFNWDPDTEGLEAEEMSSDDECVPVKRVSNIDTGTGHRYNDFCPLYLFGARHYHSYVKGNDSADDNISTPLAFLFAYTKDRATIGRISPETSDGKSMTLDDGSNPKLTLFFQFKDGLFYNFWKEYDEILRHANKIAEIKVRVPKHSLTNIDMFSPIGLGNNRWLVDSATYSLPASNTLTAEFKLRALSTQGYYDIAKEQNIPDFASIQRHLEFRLIAETYTDQLELESNKRSAAEQFVKKNNYIPHTENGTNFLIDARCAKPVKIVTWGTTWHNDPRLLPAGINDRRTMVYRAIATYDIYELRDYYDYDTGIYPDPAWELSEYPLGQISISVKYTVTLRPIWVSD